MKHLAIYFSLLSLAAIAVTAKRPDVLVTREILSHFLPINREIPLVLSAVNIGDEVAYDVTLSLYRQAYTNTSSTLPFKVRGPLAVKYAKIQPGETVQHVVRVTLVRSPSENDQQDQKAFMSIAGAPGLVVYHGKSGQTYSGISVVSQDKIPRWMPEAVALKFAGGNGWYWLVFSGMMTVTIILPLITVCSFKWKYDEAKKQRVKKVNSDEDETSATTSEDRSKTKDSAPKQFYTAKEVVKKRNRRE